MRAIASHWMCQSLCFRPGPSLCFILWISAPLGFQWLRRCLRLLITVSIYLSNSQRPLAFSDDIHDATPVHHHHVFTSFMQQWAGYSNQHFEISLPVSWLCWVITVCKHHQAHVCVFTFRMPVWKPAAHLTERQIAKVTFREMRLRKWNFFFMSMLNDEVRLRGGKMQQRDGNP